MVVKEGRFGPYVTDGETNASLRQGDDPEAADRSSGLKLLAEPPRPGEKPAKTQEDRREEARAPEAQDLKSQLSRAAARRRLCPDGLVRAR